MLNQVSSFEEDEFCVVYILWQLLNFKTTKHQKFEQQVVTCYLLFTPD
jgi:hypothetical protein